MFLRIPSLLCDKVSEGVITPTEAFFLAIVLGFDNSKQETCNASNRYFANRLHMKIGSVKNMIAKLKKQGLIEVDLISNFRTIKVTISKPMPAKSV